MYIFKFLDMNAWNTLFPSHNTKNSLLFCSGGNQTSNHSLLYVLESNVIYIYILYYTYVYIYKGYIYISPSFCIFWTLNLCQCFKKNILFCEIITQKPFLAGFPKILKH